MITPQLFLKSLYTQTADFIFCNLSKLGVIYFDQCLGAASSLHWLILGLFYALFVQWSLFNILNNELSVESIYCCSNLCLFFQCHKIVWWGAA